MKPRSALRRTAVIVMSTFVLVFPGAAAAWAHTSLQDSTPANLSRLDTSPERLELRFTEPVDPRTVRVGILDVEGMQYEGATLTTQSAGPTTTVEFSLPALPEGTYGINWQSIGGDGHRAAGEVVIGVGAVSQTQVDAARFQAVSAAERLIDASGAAGRFLWYIGLSLSIGALFILTWMTTAQQHWTQAGRSLWTGGRRWLGNGLRLALLGATVRLAATVTVMAEMLGGSSAFVRVGRALSQPGAIFEVAVIVLLFIAIRFSDATSATPYLGRGDPRWRTIAGAVGLAILAGSVGGHLRVNRPPEIAVAVTAAHILAAALWIGPLLVIALWLRSAGARKAPSAERSGLLADFFPRFARLAGWSLVVLFLTGAEALWANIGTNLFANGYGVTLAIKIALLLVVILPLAWFHDQRVRNNPATLGDPKFSKGLRIELAGLATVLVLASSLATLNPTAGRGLQAEPSNDLLSADAVTDVQECAGLTVGQANCYKTYFSALMRREDAGAAIARILELSGQDPYVATQCHQMTHDVGREAATYYDTLGEALAFEASACWSGYYHGVVEETMSRFDDAQLLSQVDSICAEAAENQYSFTHYNCVHGVGHGIMLRFDADLFQAIPYCEQYANQWELSSCVSGAFMQNVVSAQEGHTGATFREGDLVYPCNAVGVEYRDECFGMQTSYILWQSGQDLSKGFEVCDTVEAEFADDCYQSMGRDISGNSLLNPVAVVDGCNLGGEALREFCIIGASLNAVFNDHNADKANELCAMVDPIYTSACLAARDRALASFR